MDLPAFRLNEEEERLRLVDLLCERLDEAFLDSRRGERGERFLDFFLVSTSRPVSVDGGFWSATDISVNLELK